MKEINGLSEDLQKLCLWIFSDNMEFSSIPSKRKLSRNNPYVNLRHNLSIWGVKEKTEQYNHTPLIKTIDDNLQYSLSLINKIEKPYDLSNIHSMNEYINHSMAMIGNVIFSFNALLLNVVFDYCIENNKSFYLETDNETIKKNKTIYDRIKYFVDIDSSIACVNTDMEIFKKLKPIWCVKDDIKKNQNIDKIKEFLKENSKIFTITNYIDPILNQLNNKALILEKEADALLKNNNFSIYQDLKNKLYQFIGGSTSVHFNSLNKQQLILIAEYNSMTQALNLYKSTLALFNETVEELHTKDQYVRFIVTILLDNSDDTECEIFFTDNKFVEFYNNIIEEIKCHKFTTLEKGMENLWGEYQPNGNKNSLLELLYFLYQEKVIPEYIYKELSLYELLFRHQYAHGWFRYFNILTEESRNYTIDLNQKLEDLLISNDGKNKRIKNLRSSLKKVSMKNWSKKFYYMQFGIEESVCKPLSSLFKLPIINDDEWVIKFKTKHTSKYIEDIYKFCIDNKSNVFNKDDLLKEIEKRKLEEDGYYYMSLHSLVNLILMFSLFNDDYKSKKQPQISD